MRVRLTPPKRSVTDVLSRLGARLSEPEVRALFMGAQASTNLRVGPQLLLDHIFGPDLVLGDTVQDANENLQPLVWLWNLLTQEHEHHRTHLSHFEPSSPVTVENLRALVELRVSEVTWFVRGVDAGGDDPMEFGPEGERVLTGIAEGSAFLQRFQELLGRTPAPTAAELRGALQSIAELTRTLEALLDALMSISDDIRKEALAEFEKREGRTTDDGLAPARVVRVGRNAPCPCGSGKKWKRCCG